MCELKRGGERRERSGCHVSGGKLGGFPKRMKGRGGFFQIQIKKEKGASGREGKEKEAIDYGSGVKGGRRGGHTDFNGRKVEEDIFNQKKEGKRRCILRRLNFTHTKKGKGLLSLFSHKRREGGRVFERLPRTERGTV